MNETPIIGFIGAGRMAAALARGFVDSGLVAPENLIASDPVPAGRKAFGQAVGCETTDSNADVLAKAKVIFLAFKPHQLDEATETVRDQFDGSYLVISILAGVRLAKLDEACGGLARVVRVMPNTPALVGEGACGYALGQAATSDDGELVKRLLCAVGVAYEVKESLIDAVTGLSGSGPAYGYTIIEALSDGGVAAGLSRDIATRLAAQTMLGAAKMVLETGKHPGELKDMVCSPGGTTIEGVHELEEGGVRNALINAVRSATERAVELGQE
ncbi:MAG: pyrroline-5-carboxylate reductase [Pedosphaera sp.]|nr:pyrroline-5-carboxylate reductase [Pedosphaera sp.]